MKANEHPLLSPKFGDGLHKPVWYMAHPLAPDEKFTFEQNMQHVLHMMRLFLDEGFRVVAPYHTMCLVLDDDNLDHRILGLEVDCCVAASLGRIILCGHKFSSGMTREYQSVISKPGAECIDLIGFKDSQIRDYLRARSAA